MFAAYAAVGMVLSLHFNLVDSDAPSRVANAGYVLFSRDPHLGAIGFVWNPIPSLTEIPLLLLSHLWPPMLSQGQAGTFMAAAFMAGAVWQVRGITLDRGVPALWRWIIIAGFALNPMIFLYGGNGMSEAPYVFFTLWAVRRLLRWVRSDQVNDLVVAGVALGLDYLTRYEAAMAAAAATAVVIGVAMLRSSARGRRERAKLAAVDGTVVAFPFFVCFMGWTLASWITTGVAFSQFSSQYGNSSQVSNASSGVAAFQRLAGGPITIVVRDVLYLEPLLPLLVIVVLVLAVRRTEVDTLVPIGVFGGVLMFEAYAQFSGQTFAWFRFFIMTVPLMVVLATLLWPCRGDGHPDRLGAIAAPGNGVLSRRLRAVELGPGMARLSRRMSPMATSRRNRAIVGGLFVAVFVLSSIPATWAGMMNPLVGTQSEQTGLHAVVDSGFRSPAPSALRNNAYVANYIDQLNLPDGSVLMDTFIGWDVWLQSQHRKQFVITSDYDFAAFLNAPYESGIRYILVSDPVQDARADAINQRYPTIYRDGAGIASLVMTVPATGDDQTWRLYRVNPL
ncbi:MAG TPA: glycosyltransferase family 39 protein [Acidimicrobiales bacterium]|jgi:hypothetical protein|nr:glycosyltransferase family 39 protein [Acidimicrobiales bacterium]